MVDTVISLAERRIGALIAFERGISLRGYESTGVATDALFTRELIFSIFTPPLPLHDGGVDVYHGNVVFPAQISAEEAAHGA